MPERPALLLELAESRFELVHVRAAAPAVVPLVQLPLALCDQALACGDGVAPVGELASRAKECLLGVPQLVEARLDLRQPGGVRVDGDPLALCEGSLARVQLGDPPLELTRAALQIRRAPVEPTSVARPSVERGLACGQRALTVGEIRGARGQPLCIRLGLCGERDRRLLARRDACDRGAELLFPLLDGADALGQLALQIFQRSTLLAQGLTLVSDRIVAVGSPDSTCTWYGEPVAFPAGNAPAAGSPKF